jgi:hypothetical protein
MTSPAAILCSRPASGQPGTVPPTGIARILAEVGDVTTHGLSRWTVRVPHGIDIDIELLGEWLVLGASPPVGASLNDGPAAVLRLQGRLPGNAKFTVDDTSGALGVRLELPFAGNAVTPDDPPPDSFHPRLLSACLDCAHASTNRMESWHEAGDTIPSAALLDAVALCRQAGWTAIHPEGNDPRIAIEDAERGAMHAVVRPGPAAARFVVNLRDVLPADLDAQALEAIALVMLRTASAVRLVRPCFSPPDELGFEVELPPEPLAADADAALSALCAATRLCSLEVEALASDLVLSGAYLAAWAELAGSREPVHESIL